MIFHAIKIHKFSVVIHAYIFFKVVCKSKLLLESGLQLQYIRIMGLIKNIFKRKQKNLQTSIVTNSTHSSIIQTKNISSYAILEHDRLDAAAKFQAHHVYKS
jgi:uncharacterized membrane protein YcgQ (UPF0703/DUF1980 family)